MGPEGTILPEAQRFTIDTDSIGSADDGKVYTLDDISRLVEEGEWDVCVDLLMTASRAVKFHTTYSDQRKRKKLDQLRNTLWMIQREAGKEIPRRVFNNASNLMYINDSNR